MITKTHKLKCLIRFILAVVILPLSLPIAITTWFIGFFIFLASLIYGGDASRFFILDPYGPFIVISRPITTLGGYRNGNT